jgi:hypothetical protein
MARVRLKTARIYRAMGIKKAVSGKDTAFVKR